MTEDLSTGFDGITWPDYIVIALYFIFVLAVGLFVSFDNLYLTKTFKFGNKVMY